MNEKINIKNITIQKVDEVDSNKYFLMNKDIIVSKECYDLGISELGSPMYKMFSVMLKGNNGDEHKKYIILGTNRQFFSIRINNNDEYLFDEITTNPDVGIDGNMSLMLRFDKGKMFLLEVDGNVFTYKMKDQNGNERKYFDEITRDKLGNTEVKFNGKEYRVTKSESQTNKSLISSIFSMFK